MFIWREDLAQDMIKGVAPRPVAGATVVLVIVYDTMPTAHGAYREMRKFTQYVWQMQPLLACAF